MEYQALPAPSSQTDLSEMFVLMGLVLALVRRLTALLLGLGWPNAPTRWAKHAPVLVAIGSRTNNELVMLTFTNSVADIEDGACAGCFDGANSSPRQRRPDSRHGLRGELRFST